MPLITIVEDYIFSAMKHAVLEELDDGAIGATIPECPGVLGFGADVHSCAADLYVQLQDWVRVSLELGNPLPVIDGIDLNSDSGKLLATYHRNGSRARPAEYYESDEAFEAALEGHAELG
jgi:predicted RNase H-like HicB family nuclease